MCKVVLINDLPSPPIGKTGWPWDYGNTPHVPVTLPNDIPLVTIVTPSFNQGAYLEATIRSVLLQGYPSLEYLVIDGGSTDESIEIIEKYSDWINYWVSESDKGQADAINKGFKLASGSLYAWLNSDDYYFPGGLSRLVSGWIESRADLMHGDVWQVKEHGEPYPWRSGDIFEYEKTLRSLNIPTPQQGTMWTKSLWSDVGGLDTKWRCVLDRDFFNKAGLYHKFHYIPAPIAVSRIHENAKSHSLQLKWIDELPHMYRDFFKNSDLPIHIRKLEKSTMYAVWQRCADIARRNGISTKYFLLQAIKEAPIKFIVDEIDYLKSKYLKFVNN